MFSPWITSKHKKDKSVKLLIYCKDQTIHISWSALYEPKSDPHDISAVSCNEVQNDEQLRSCPQEPDNGYFYPAILTSYLDVKVT